MSYNYRTFKLDTGDRYVINCVNTQYERTSRNGKWHVCQERKSICDENFYNNVITSIPFFASVGTCRTSWSYTFAGYLPTSTTAYRPDGLAKSEFKFTFTLRG